MLNIQYSRFKFKISILSEPAITIERVVVAHDFFRLYVRALKQHDTRVRLLVNYLIIRILLHDFGEAHYLAVQRHVAGVQPRARAADVHVALDFNAPGLRHAYYF